MKIIRLNNDVKIGVVPRITPILTDELILKVRNEVSNLEMEIIVLFTIENERIIITFDVLPDDFIAGNKYEIEVYNETTLKTIYLGKLLIVKNDTDLQNYTPSKQRTQRYKAKA